jgi:hypothetical protein
MLRFPLSSVESMVLHHPGDGIGWHEREEVEVSLHICVGCSQKEL